MKKFIFSIIIIFFTLFSNNIIFAGAWGDGTYGYVDTGVGSDYDVHWGNGEDGYID